MAVNSTALRANLKAVGDLFFSGSQTVTKGDEVIWILDETYAFKVTEKCRVSTNASPFVNLDAGDVFIIYKRTEADIEAKNAKGVYIFDRDTVVGLAYPQEVTQDIIIENDLYNNNYNSITVESDKTPTAKITVSNSQPIVGETITVSGTSSYSVSPATISSYSWKKNGYSISSSSKFTYKTSRVGQDDITLVVTDSDGRKNNASIGVVIKAKPIIDDYIAREEKAVLQYDWSSWNNIMSISPNISGSGKITVSATIKIRVETYGQSGQHPNNHTVQFRIKDKNGSVVASMTKTYQLGLNQTFSEILKFSKSGSITPQDKYTISWVDHNGGLPDQSSAGNGTAVNGTHQMQINLTNRTK